MSQVKVIWLKKVRGRYGQTIQRIQATLITASEEYCTVELETGERYAAKTGDVKLVKKASA
jgi:hypothetical protein